ncbi:hypothetical protein CCMSSC00406_0005365 [Pleurotus cornucopiae]|uniref:Uncharacterized protein n=1 Tax=Pleurotus cornucopiae TaxID=5321 RepID=A0ACB7IQY0_PLECO|nr:hypothetical protein CCMSSC00406_0005365 [Pleurotus cornucopiae]
MARVTRQSAKKAVTASPSTTTRTGTPVFSATTSVPETPATSNDEETEVKTVPVTRSKRRARSEDDDIDGELALPKRPTKRRAISQVFVEIPSVVRAKGKGKARAVSPPSDNDDDELVSEHGLEFEEQSFSSSGSEFEDSDDEDDKPSGTRPSTRRTPRKDEDQEALFELEESDAEELMLRAAIVRSLGGARSGEGSSSKNAAALCAAAAERRIARANLQDNIEFELNSDDLDESASESESEEEPLSKGKGKAKATSAKVNDTSRKKKMTLAQLRAERREQARIKRLEKKANWKEERDLIRKLGRKLTHAEKSTVALHKFHPELKDVWGDLEASIEIITPQKAEQPANLKVTLLPFQQESLFWMREQEKGIWGGGMLADEMGMGKTIQIIALLVSDLKAPNLVIAPTVAIMQWRNEIAAHTDGIKVLVWHGSSRETNIKEMAKYDVILTTYAVVESCFRKQESGFTRKGFKVREVSPVHQIQWNRVILDEAHNIKERSTNTAKATFELKANYRWCLSGTPLQNRVGELYSLVRFLGGDPFSYYFCKKCDCKSLHWRFSDKRNCDDCGHSPMQHTCFWNNEILTPIQKNGMVGPGKIAFKKLKILLDCMMLRRTKLQRADDLDLPPRTVIVRRDYFSPEEKELYLSLFSDAKRQFNTYLDQGTVLNNYSNIFSLLTRMRQMACHPDLVLRSKTNAQVFMPENGEATVCRLCNDIAEDAIQSKCRHIFDRECIKQYLNTAIEQTPSCPVCHLPLTIDLEAPALEIEENITARQGILGRLDLSTWRSSSKIEALVEELSNLRMQDSTTKSLVFSQFVNFLDLIAFRLQRAGFNICRLEGTMTPAARDATIQHFMNNVDVTVFLVSLKAGGVALNLTEASRVYLMDSWWNPAVEYQAMDRIHRLGQHRPVKAIKLVVEDSIESRIIQLQEKKSAMVDATLSTDDSAMGRLTPEDLGFLFRL